MREIKFRGKRVHTKEWVEGWLFHDQIFDGNSGSADVMVIRDDCDGDYIVSEETIGQFTGLTDKNGKEIYEGDIVKFDLDYQEIVKYEGATFWPFGETRSLGEVDECEIIGNIHDQELSKGEK
jgi:uncharacterized phage protein (TIGR01671 family)